MDALKFLQTAKRMCNAGCDKNVPGTNCCLYDLCNDFLCYQNAVKVIRDALEKLDAIEESKETVWHDAQNDPPKENDEYLCYYEYFRYGNYNCMYRTMDRGYFFNGQWSGEPTHGTSAKVLAWTELPAPPTKEKINDDNNPNMA